MGNDIMETTTADQIKKVALEQFALYDYDGATLRNIARAVNIQTSSIYFHFKNKEALFLEIFEDIIKIDTKKIADLASALEELPIEQQLKQILIFYCLRHNNKTESEFFDRFVQFPPLELGDKIYEGLMVFEKDVLNIITKIFEKGIEHKKIKAIPLEKLIYIYICLLDGMAMEYYYYKSDDLAKRLDIIWDAFWMLIKV